MSSSDNTSDAIVVVGDKEYRHNKYCLRASFRLFDEALACTAGEGEAPKFELPSKFVPGDWEMIVSLMGSPFVAPTKKLTMGNLPVAVELFRYLQCDLGLEACDQLLKQKVPSPSHDQTSNDIKAALDILRRAVEYDLAATKGQCLLVLKKKAVVGRLKKSQAMDVLAFMKKDNDCHAAFWKPMNEHLTKEVVKSMDVEEHETLLLSLIKKNKNDSDFDAWERTIALLPRWSEKKTKNRQIQKHQELEFGVPEVLCLFFGILFVAFMAHGVN